MPAAAVNSDLTAKTAPPRAAAGEVSKIQPLLFSCTVLLGAFLLFLLEPLFAKLILPWFGGSAAVWAVCLVFFQSALLLGYLYADLTTRHLTPARQMQLHITLLLLCLFFLPIAPNASWRPQPGGDPTWRILGLLTACIGLPFLLLSATSPLVQTWQARRRPAEEPYPLFALSNLASLAALLSFPFVIEPRLSSHRQALLWSALFVVFVILCSQAAWAGRGNAGSSAAPLGVDTDVASVTLREKLLWLSLSACGSMLLLSFTNHLLENIAPVPLLWVLPLALYLATFTLAFNRRSLYSRWLTMRILAVALGSLGYAIHDPKFTESIQVSVPFFCAGLFICCFFCHGELARLRPVARHLTSFYVMISTGGALGAILIGLAAPRLFSGIYEFPLALCLTALLAIAVLWTEGWLVRIFWTLAAIAMCVVLVINIRHYHRDTIFMTRSFYGALRVEQRKNWLSEPYRTLYHGKIEHGAQFLHPPKSRQATTYYAKNSGIGFALDLCCSALKRVGVIGLGAGTLAAYGEPGDAFRFYEINPQIIIIAETRFRFLRDTQAKIEIAVGEARLSLAAESPQRFDVLAVDAFSGDAIPVHLLTKEAFALYLHHLKPDGVLAFHTSNTYLNLAPVVQLLAQRAGLETRLVINSDDRRLLVDSSDWVLATRNHSFLEALDSSVFIDPIPVIPGLRAWTDDYNNLFQILRPITYGSPSAN